MNVTHYLRYVICRWCSFRLKVVWLSNWVMVDRLYFKSTITTSRVLKRHQQNGMQYVKMMLSKTLAMQYIQRQTTCPICTWRVLPIWKPVSTDFQA